MMSLLGLSVSMNKIIIAFAIMNNKFQFNFVIRSKMSTQIFSDEETVDKFTSPSLQHLINENKMKDLALGKATNLIELLNIELEVQKNSHQEAIRLIEDDLKYRYEQEIDRLNEKIDCLDRQVKKNQMNNITTEKAYRSALQRTNSAKSLENKKRSVNKKYTQAHKNEAKQKGHDERLPFENEFYRQLFVDIQDWKSTVIIDLNAFVKEEYQELASILNKIENSNEEVDEAFAQPRIKKDIKEQLLIIIKSQQATINSMRIYSQELEDVVKGLSFKLQNVYNRQQVRPHEAKCNPHFQEVYDLAALIIQKKKHQWQSDITVLEGENLQLKNILDSMIRLVKEQKKLRT